jgi:hypothetical protein
MGKVQTPEEFFNSFGQEAPKEVEKPVSNQKEEEALDLNDEQDDQDGGDDSFEGVDNEDSGEEPSGSEEEGGDSAEEGQEGDEVEEDESESEDGDVEANSADDDGITFEDDIDEDPKFNDLAKELGWEGVSSKEKFLEKYNESVSKAKEDAFEGVPDNLKEAVALAKEGGDYMSILETTSVNYDEFSNDELVKANAEKYFKSEDGKIDRDALEDWFESKGKAEINMMGDQIRTSLKLEQKQKVEGIKQQTAREKEESQRALKAHIDSLSVVGGVKLRSSDKEKMFKDTVSGLAMEELFYENGKVSEKKLAENLFKIRSFDKAIKLAKSASTNDGKRQVLSKATNSTVRKPATKPRAETKKVSHLDNFYEMLKQKKS